MREEKSKRKKTCTRIQINEDNICQNHREKINKNHKRRKKRKKGKKKGQKLSKMAEERPKQRNKKIKNKIKNKIKKLQIHLKRNRRRGRIRKPRNQKRSGLHLQTNYRIKEIKSPDFHPNLSERGPRK